MPEITVKDFSENLSAEDEALVRQMFEAGLQWGRAKQRTHPKMKPYIFATRGEIQIIDLGATLEKLRAAEEFLAGLVKSGGTVMIVGTQPAAKILVKETAERLHFPYVHEKWLGGTLTNSKTFLGRIDYLQKLEQKINSPEFESYTKRERSQFTQEYDELREKFQGIRGMTALPQALLLIGVNRHFAALKEAKKRNIPVVAVANTDDDITQVDWPIPANDNATTSITFILARLEDIMAKAKAAAVEIKEKKKEVKEAAGVAK